MDKVQIYHNPRCSKSRQTLSLLKEMGVVPEVIHYLDDIPTKDDLHRVLTRLGGDPHDVVRDNEDAYIESGLTPGSSLEDIISAIVQYPILLNRPIVVIDDKAKLCRPPELLHEIM